MDYNKFIEGKAEELQELRDEAIRGVDKAFSEGDSHLFDEASSAFDGSSGLMDRLGELSAGQGISLDMVSELTQAVELTRLEVQKVRALY